MNYTNLLNKNVISIFDGAVCSKIRQGVIKNGRLVYLVLQNDDKKIILKVKDIFSYSFDSIMIKNKQKLIITNNENEPSFLDKEVFTATGKQMGKVVDIIFNEHFVVQKIITEKCEFDSQKIIVNNDIIIINEQNSNYHLKNFKPTNKINIPEKPEQKVVITSKIPIKVIAGNFLVGKKLFRDLVSPNNIVLARKNSIVSISLINTAKEHNSLVELSKCVL